MQTLLLAVAVLPVVAAGLTQVAKKLDQKLQTKVLYQKAVAPALWVQWQLSHKVTSLTQLGSWQVTADLEGGSILLALALILRGSQCCCSGSDRMDRASLYSLKQ